MRANAFEPVTFVRSPTLMKSVPDVTLNGSRPARRIMCSVMACGWKFGSWAPDIWRLLMGGWTKTRGGSDSARLRRVAVLARPAPWLDLGEGARYRCNMLGGRAAAAARDVYEPGLREFLQES